LTFHYGTIYTYIAEQFPSHLRGITLGISVAVGRVVASTAGYIMLLGERNQIHPYSFMLISGLISFPISYLMSETKGLTLKN
jgi:ABC-type phosphate transport system permease subunit